MLKYGVSGFPTFCLVDREEKLSISASGMGKKRMGRGRWRHGGEGDGEQTDKSFYENSYYMSMASTDVCPCCCAGRGVCAGCRLSGAKGAPGKIPEKAILDAVSCSLHGQRAGWVAILARNEQPQEVRGAAG